MTRISTSNRSSGINYISNAKIDGEDLNRTSISHFDLLGGDIEFELSQEPTEWAKEQRSTTSIEDHEMVPVPYFNTEFLTFTDQAIVEIGAVGGAVIRYTMSGREVSPNSTIYQGPILIDRTREFRAKAFIGNNSSAEIVAIYHKIEGGKSIQLDSEYANQYSAGGDRALIDYQKGGVNYRTGKWQGYQEDLVATVDLGQVKNISKVGVGFLQDIKSWIWYPIEMEVLVSTDGEIFESVGEFKNEFPEDQYGGYTQEFVVDGIGHEAKFVKIVAKNYGVCPDWHLGAGGTTWIFADEITIE